MAAYDYMNVAVAGMGVGIADARTVDCPTAQEEIEFGRPTFGYIGENTAYNFKKDVGIGLYSADFVTSNSIAFSVNGVAITPVVFATDHATTMTALINAVTALDGVEASLDAADTNGRTILVRVKGETALITSVVTLGST